MSVSEILSVLSREILVVIKTESTTREKSEIEAGKSKVNSIEIFCTRHPQNPTIPRTGISKTYTDFVCESGLSVDLYFVFWKVLIARTIMMQIKYREAYVFMVGLRAQLPASGPPHLTIHSRKSFQRV